MYRPVTEFCNYQIIVNYKGKQIFSSQSKRNNYYSEIKPFLICLRLLGRFPYTLPDNEPIRYRLLSWPTLYAVIFYALQVSWTTRALLVIYELKIAKSSSYDQTVQSVFFSAFILHNLIVPLTYWREAKKIAEYVKIWRRFQEEFNIENLDFSMPFLVKIIFFVVIPGTSLLFSFQAFILIDVPFAAFSPFILALIATLASFNIWCITLRKIKIITKQLQGEMIKGKNYKIKCQRKMWMMLSNLMTKMGENMGHTGIHASIINFCTYTLATYGLLSYLLKFYEGRISLPGLTVASFNCALLHFVLCDQAHDTTDELTRKFTSRILELDYTTLSKEHLNELDLLLKTIAMKPPSIQLLNFVTVDRSLFVRFISNAVTYLVLLIQIKVSSLTNSIDTQ